MQMFSSLRIRSGQFCLSKYPNSIKKSLRTRGQTTARLSNLSFFMTFELRICVSTSLTQIILAQEAKVREEIFDSAVPSEARARHENNLLGRRPGWQVSPTCALRHRQVHLRVLQPHQLHCHENNNADRVKCRRQARGHRPCFLRKYFYEPGNHVFLF